jgi:hypothetical protein
VIVDVEIERPGRPRRALLVAALAVAALAVSGAPDVPASLGTLTLPPGEGDVQLAAIPEWLVNDPQPRHMGVIVVRRTIGIAADSEGAATLSWSERGYYYRLSSSTLGVAQLARVAARLR